MKSPTVAVRGLDFRYGGDDRWALRGVDLDLAAGERCVLLGRNGAGKTTLLRVLAGRHLVASEAVRVLGRPAFHDPALAGRVIYLGGRFPFRVDVTVAEILARTAGAETARGARLVGLLGIDRAWHMDRVSDGQRRRVQLLLGLLRPAEVVLLDEVMTDLDLLARADLLTFLREESEVRGATICYATHILDELDGWATHAALLHAGRLLGHAALPAIPELAALRAAGTPAPLSTWARGWLRRPAAAVAADPTPRDAPAAAPPPLRPARSGRGG
jgi:CCR4-NOT complex subunit CAF16